MVKVEHSNASTATGDHLTLLRGWNVLNPFDFCPKYESAELNGYLIVDFKKKEKAANAKGLDSDFSLRENDDISIFWQNVKVF